MIEIKLIDHLHRADIDLPNRPFKLFGRLIPRLEKGVWSYDTELFETETEMCFPDEDYDYDMMSGSFFLGAYDGDVCVGLLILQPGFFKYMYLYDLKVEPEYRRRGVAGELIKTALRIAKTQNSRGIYTCAQDNNLAACMFYLKNGFRIGGFDSEVYKGTEQEGKADIMFYIDCPETDEEE